MFDFVRKTRAPTPRINLDQDLKRNKPLHRLIFYHPRLFVAICLSIISILIGYTVLQNRAVWDGSEQHGFLVVFGSDDDVLRSLSVVIIQGEKERATVLQLPETLVLESLHGYGMYKTSSLYGLARLEQLPAAYITQTISLQLGLDVRDILWISDRATSLSVDKLSSSFLSAILLQERSTLSMMDRYRMWKFFSTLRKDQFSTIDLASSSVTRLEQEGGGGEELFRLDPIKLDPLVFQLFSDELIRKENKAVSIVNTTNEPRLGTRIARAFSNMGIDVISVTSTSDGLEDSQLLLATDEDALARATETIQQTLLLSNSAIKTNSQKALEFRSDIVLFIGQDLANLFTGEEK